MNTFCFAVLYLFLIVPPLAQPREVCFTIDDLPTVSYSIQRADYQLALTEDLLTTFDQYQIPAIGFVNEGKLYRDGVLDSNQVNLLGRWLQHGYELGNHTFSHINYHITPLGKYSENIIQGEQITGPLMRQHQHTLTYFRHPYLRIGLTKAHHDSLQQFLAQRQYQEAPVTIDNDDYLFAKAYHNALVAEDSALMRQIGDEYVRYMEDKLVHFERAAEILEKRPIKQILLLHANQLNADYLDELAKMYQRRQYTFISLKEALTDPVYQQEITAYGDWGISWLDRWALSRGVTDFFKSDPPTPTHIIQMAESK